MDLRERALAACEHDYTIEEVAELFGLAAATDA